MEKSKPIVIPTPKINTMVKKFIPLASSFPPITKDKQFYKWIKK